jgi:NifU-like protein involved in Fe-S cluster formation
VSAQDHVPDYSPLVVEHFERPRNGGRFERAPDTIEGVAGSVAHGAMFTLSARLAAERIKDVRYEVYGCPHCIAAGSWLSERLIGATCSELSAWSWREAADALQMPAEKRGRLLILEDAVHSLAEAWRAVIP